MTGPTSTSTSRLVLLFLFIGAFGGCGPAVDSFIDTQGTYPDGKAIAFHEQAQRVVCDATMASSACHTLISLRLVDSTENYFRGVRIDYFPSMVMEGMTYTSGLLQPVILYAVRAVTDPTTNLSSFEDSSIDGGQITFAHLATASGDTTTGTFSNMMLQRPDQNGNMQTLVTLTQGTIQYYQP